MMEKGEAAEACESETCGVVVNGCEVVCFGTHFARIYRKLCFQICLSVE